VDEFEALIWGRRLPRSYSPSRPRPPRRPSPAAPCMAAWTSGTGRHRSGSGWSGPIRCLESSSEMRNSTTCRLRSAASGAAKIRRLTGGHRSTATSPSARWPRTNPGGCNTSGLRGRSIFRRAHAH